MRFKLHWTNVADGQPAASNSNLPSEIDGGSEDAAREAALRLLNSGQRSQFACKAEAIRVHAGAEVDA